MSIRHFDLLTEVFKYSDFAAIRTLSHLNKKMFFFCQTPRIQQFIRLKWVDHILNTCIISREMIFYDKLFRACDKANDYQPITRLIPLLPKVTSTYSAIKIACRGSHCKILGMMLQNKEYTFSYYELYDATRLGNYELVETILASPNFSLENFFGAISFFWNSGRLSQYDEKQLDIAFQQLDIQILDTFRKDIDLETNRMIHNSNLSLHLDVLDNILFFVRKHLQH